MFLSTSSQPHPRLLSLFLLLFPSFTPLTLAPWNTFCVQNSRVFLHVCHSLFSPVGGTIEEHFVSHVLPSWLVPQSICVDEFWKRKITFFPISSFSILIWFRYGPPCLLPFRCLIFSTTTFLFCSKCFSRRQLFENYATNMLNKSFLFSCSSEMAKTDVVGETIRFESISLSSLDRPCGLGPCKGTLC